MWLSIRVLESSSQRPSVSSMLKGGGDALGGGSLRCSASCAAAAPAISKASAKAAHRAVPAFTGRSELALRYLLRYPLMDPPTGPCHGTPRSPSHRPKLAVWRGENEDSSLIARTPNTSSATMKCVTFARLFAVPASSQSPDDDVQQDDDRGGAGRKEPE